MIFHIYHVFTPFMKLHGFRFLYFFSLGDIRNEAVFLLLEHSSLRGVKEKKHKKHKILAFKPILQEIQMKNLTSRKIFWSTNIKFWNKKNTYCRSLPKWSKIELYSPPYGMIKNLWQSIQGIATWNSREKIKSAIPREQNYVAWLVKNGKTVFSKLTRKISLSVSGEQASRQAIAQPGVFLSQNFRYFPAF